MSDEITIQAEGVNIGDVNVINFIEGTNVTLTVAIEPNEQRANITVTSSGGGGGGASNGYFPQGWG